MVRIADHEIERGLRYAAMNALETRALDCRPRCGWLSAMRRMSSSHVSTRNGRLGRAGSGLCGASGGACPGLIERGSAVGFGTVQDGVNVERTGRVFDEADAVVADA
jgi:hypothetical protein